MPGSGTRSDLICFRSNVVLDDLAQRVDAYFASRSMAFTVPAVQRGSAFTTGVWRALVEIPSGETRSYGDVARAVGRPDAVREVARANGANQVAIIVPCRRVVGADGSLTGYGKQLVRRGRER